MSGNARSVLIAITILLSSISIGTVGYMWFEDYVMLDAFYMTMLLISTVGFSEIAPLSDSGKLFSSIYMLFNIGLYAYIVSIISRYMFEGEFRKVFAKFILNKKSKKVTDHIIVVGYGRTGARTCDELLKSKKQFILIEHDQDALDDLPEDPKFSVLKDDASKEETLLTAGIENAKSLIITLPNDADNMLICITAKGLNPNIEIIARASEESAEKKLYRAGANKVVKPFAIGGIHMAHLITQPYVIELLEILTGITERDLKLEEFEFHELKEEYKNKTIKELDIRNNTGATVLGIKDKEKGFIFDPNSDTTIENGDILIILGSEESIRNFKMYCT
ncbi:MAG: potassium channel protein [Cyclobacteriaceae bacterium]